MADITISASDIASAITKGLEGFSPSLEQQTVGRVVEDGSHQELLAKNGIYILENMDTRELAKDKAYEFMFVLGAARMTGAVQMIINPVAIR